jgi:hypothetical protein
MTLTETSNGPGDEERSRGARRTWPLFVGLPIIALIAVGAVVLSGSGDSGGGTSGGVELPHPSGGDADAPVTMIEYLAAPLFLMALLWERIDLGSRRWPRGGEVSVGTLRLHTTGLVSGGMFVLLGVVFIGYEGTPALAGLYERGGTAELIFAAERWIEDVAGGTVATLALGALLLAAAVLLRGRLTRGKKEPLGR